MVGGLVEDRIFEHPGGWGQLGPSWGADFCAPGCAKTEVFLNVGAAKTQKIDIGNVRFVEVICVFRSKTLCFFPRGGLGFFGEFSLEFRKLVWGAKLTPRPQKTPPGSMRAPTLGRFWVHFGTQDGTKID